MKAPTDWAAITHRGMAGLVFGLLLLLGPGKSLARVAPILIFYAMADGVLAISAAARAASARDRWRSLLVDGVAGTAGVLLIGLWPDAPYSAMLWCIAAWATVTAITAATRTAASGKDRLLAVAGVVLIRFVALAAGASGCGEQTIAIWAAANGLFFTALFLTRMLRLRAGGGVPWLHAR